jgi:hypothetical protein
MGEYMSNATLYFKTKRVLESCETVEQFKVAFRYSVLARKALDECWRWELCEVCADQNKRYIKLVEGTVKWVTN